MSRASAAWDVCPAGHAYTEENTGRDKRGHRWCKACAAARNRRQYYAQSGRPVPQRCDRRGRRAAQQPHGQQGPPPPEWVDWVVVHRLVTGREHPGRAPTWAEKRDAAARMHRGGHCLTAIAARLRSSGETTHALLAAAGIDPTTERREGVDAA